MQLKVLWALGTILLLIVLLKGVTIKIVTDEDLKKGLDAHSLVLEGMADYFLELQNKKILPGPEIMKNGKKEKR